MPTTFKNAPLVEIVAELRWNPEPFFLGAPGQVGFLNPNQCEVFFQKLLIEVSKIGFSSSERLVPQGMLILPNQIVYRFRSADGTKLLQAGIGVFSANAVPPYHSWTQFAPILHDGFSTAFRILQSFGHSATLNAVSLRYIDAFTSIHMGDVEPAVFMQEILNLRSPVPNVVEKLLDKSKPIRSQMQLNFPLEGELLLTMNIGEGMNANRRALVLDSAVSTVRAVPIDNTFAELDRQYAILHSLFMDLTRPIATRLEPVND